MNCGALIIVVWWEYFLGQNFVDQVLAFDVGEVRPLLIVRKVRADTFCHRQHDRAVNEVEPIGTADEFAILVAREWIVRIETEVGAEVEEDDVLLIVESMKMEIPVEAPEDGRVAEIRVAEGQAIEEGDILVVLES